MAKRDVELVVRARNEASKSLQAITSALDELTKAQGKTGEGAEKTGSTLARLGDELNKLSSALTKSTGVDKLGAAMDKASAAVSRMEQSLAKTAAEGETLRAQMAESAVAAAKLAQEVENLKARLAAEKAAAAAAAAEQKKLATELIASQSALQKSVGSADRYAREMTKIEGEISGLVAKQRQLADAMAQVETPTKKMQTAYATLEAKLQKAQERLYASRQAFMDNKEAVGQFGGAVVKLQGALAQSESVLTRAKAAVEGTKAQLLEVGKASKEATGNLNRLESAVASNAASFSRQQGQLNQATQDLRELSTAADLARRKSAELDNAAFRKVSDDAAQLGRAAEYVRWWTQALEAADRAEDKLAANPSTVGTRAVGYNQAAAAAQRMGQASRQAADGLNDLEEKGRAAMTWGQRLRGEMIALALSFAGVYAAIDQMRRVLQTTMDIDAANTRLGVAFDNDQMAVAQEMKFIEQQSARLGISIKVLANEYSKLAIATKETSLAGSETRRIFLSLAEAFRVGNLSQAHMELAFNAISQMVNKGSVSMEELRQQLGERLAGAFNLAAEAMGYTTSEFAKLVAEGKIATEDFLPKLADQLDATFKSGLPQALQNVSADLGKFQDQLDKAYLAFGRGGFTEGLQESLRELTDTLKSNEARAALRNLGALTGEFLKLLAKIPDTFEIIAVVAGVTLGPKLFNLFAAITARVQAFAGRVAEAANGANTASGAFSSLGVAVGQTAVETKKAEAINNAYLASVGRSNTALMAATTRTRAYAGAVRVLNGALGVMRGLWAALGGLPGILTSVAFGAVGYLLTRIGQTNDALSRHVELMGKVEEAYDKAAKKGGKWVDSLEGITTLDLRKNLDDLLEQFGDQRDEALRKLAARLGGTITLKRGDFGNAGKELAELIELAQRGSISMKQFRDLLSELSERNDVAPEIVDAAKAFSKLTAEAGETELAIAKAYNVLKDAGVEVKGVSPAIQSLAVDLKEAGDKAAEGADKGASGMKKLEDAIRNVRGQISNFKEIDDLTADLKALDRQLDELGNTPGIDKASEKFREFAALVQRAKNQRVEEYVGKSGLVDTIVGIESSGNPNAKNPKSSATGLGQFIERTWLSLFRKYFPDEAARMGKDAILELRKDAELSKKMVALYAQENAKILQEAGVSVDKAAIYLAHFLGPDGAVKVLKAGLETPISQLLDPKQINANQSILAGKNAGQVIAWAERKVGLTQSELEARKRVYDIERESSKKAEERVASNRKYNEDLQSSLEVELKALEAKKAAQDTDRKGQEMLSREKAIELAEEEAIVKAKKDQKTLDEETIKLIRERAALNWEIAAQEKAAQERQRQQAEGEQKINMLQQLRRDLLQQLEIAQDSGDTEKMRDLATQIQSVDDRLLAAIAKMEAFWNSVADPDAREAGLASLAAIRAGLQNVGQKTEITAKSVGNLFGDELQSGFANFLSKIRETGDVFGSLKESFRNFASSFLLSLAQMIAKVAIFNALAGLGKQGGFIGTLFSGFAKVNHTGGVVGVDGASRAVSPAWFNNAIRYHTGGIAGLKPNEVPTILERGEEVLTADDPRHIANGGGMSGANVKIINTIDSGSVISEGMSTAEGERAFINFIRANKASIKQVLA